MARDHARINVTIWGDPDFRVLPSPAQHLYLTLWTAPSLSYCGVHDWRSRRLAARSTGYTPDDIEAAGACLEARHFLVIDHETEECLIRSWVRFDGLMKQPRMAVSFAKAYADVESETISQVLVHELTKVRDESPDLACWGDKRVAEVLEHPSISAKDLPPVSDPFGVGFTPSLGQAKGNAWGLPTPSPAPSPTPTSIAPPPSHPEAAKKTSAGRKRPATSLPEDWKPSEAHWERRHDGIDVQREADKFRLHAEANDRRQVSWNAAFSQWLLNAHPSGNVRPIRTDDQGRQVLPPLPGRSPWGPA